MKIVILHLRVKNGVFEKKTVSSLNTTGLLQKKGLWSSCACAILVQSGSPGAQQGDLVQKKFLVCVSNA